MFFEQVETGARVDRQTFDRQIPGLRVDLINAQYDLRQADFPVVILIGGDDRIAAEALINTLYEWLDGRYLATHWFGPPGEEARERPRSWRYWRNLPARGQLGVFVGAWATNPISAHLFGDDNRDAFERRLAHVRRFEQSLTDDGALLIKFWLHLPAKAQKQRARAARNGDDKAWKFIDEDWKLYKSLPKALPLYEHMLRVTGTTCAPWHLVETTDRRHRDMTVARRLLDTLRRRLDAPATTPAPVAGPTPGEPCCGALDQVDLAATLEYDTYKNELRRYQRKIQRRSQRAATQGRTSVVLFEGWDAAGKGGVIRRLMHAMQARDYRVVSIAAPSEEELAHPYLWRFWRRLPRAGKTVIFDRSWYGRVLVERVEGLASPATWQRAYTEINDFESQLVEAGFNVQKFWLHIDPDEQLRRFKARENTPYKKYKITDDDYRNRSRWDAYVCAVNDMVERTSTDAAPWHLIAANNKRYARVAVAKQFSKSLK